MNTRTRIAVCAVLLAFAVCLTALSPLLQANAQNSSPVAENMEISTYRNVSVGGRLSAVDPDGDVLTYQITTEPVKGNVELTSDGRFVYSPDLNKRGRDYFGYKATDSEGNSSQEATVIIRICKQSTQTVYDDMTGNAAGYAAVALSENGIFTGEQIGSSMVFSPEDQVTRGEFLAMCMQLAGTELLTGVMSTGFTDDGNIPGWQKPYVATALMDGIISGYSGDGSVVFDAESLITCSEAAVMLDNIMGLTNVSVSRYSDTAPAWACQSVANLSACDIMPGSCAYDAELTRADAALMLVSAMDILESR
ncbi:MAG: S-layer homology domain-containing protein [Clostridia bacterium]|nr:S-layer homology domain-containing protein [Clostridia bacterium]